MTEHPEREPDLPPRLQRDLRRVFGSSVQIPATIDAALARAAREQLRPRRGPAFLRPVFVTVAAAAALLLATLFVLPRRAVREDFDRNGCVDVLDAYRLALALQRGDAVPASMDLDGDGRVDRRDVEAIAARAVRVHG